MNQLASMSLPSLGEVHFKLFIDEGSGYIRARTAAGQNIGYMTWDYPEPDTIELCDIMINKDLHRGHGLGSYLLKSLIQFAKETNTSKVIGHTAEQNNKVHNFYRSLGFEFSYPPERGEVMFVIQTQENKEHKNELT